MADPFAELGKLIGNLETLASKGAEVVAEKLEPKLQAVLEAEYEQGRGPDGQTWAPLKADGSASHLQESGAMRAGTQVVRGVKGVSVRVPKPGGFHQDGTSRMTARPLVPSGDTLPESWAKAAEETALEVIVGGVTK